VIIDKAFTCMVKFFMRGKKKKKRTENLPVHTEATSRTRLTHEMIIIRNCL